MPEDPVAGSLNAAIAQWLTAKGLVPQRYSAQQGRMLGRCGKIRVEVDEGTVWIGGPVHDRVRGTVTPGAEVSVNLSAQIFPARLSASTVTSPIYGVR